MDELVAEFYWWDNQVSIYSDGSVYLERRLCGRVNENGDVLVNGEPIANVRPDGGIWTEMECVGHLVPGYAVNTGAGGIGQGPFCRLDDVCDWSAAASCGGASGSSQSGDSYPTSSSGDSKIFGCIGTVVLACVALAILGWVYNMVVAAGAGIAYSIGSLLAFIWKTLTQFVLPAAVVFLIASFVVGKVTGESLVSRIRYRM